MVKRLGDQTSELARQEVELAKAELAEKGRALGIGAGAFGAAGEVGLFAFGALTATVILALAEAMDAWLAALIVTVMVAPAAISPEWTFSRSMSNEWTVTPLLTRLTATSVFAGIVKVFGSKAISTISI